MINIFGTYFASTAEKTKADFNFSLKYYSNMSLLSNKKNYQKTYL